jgi:hypothetical protein
MGAFSILPSSKPVHLDLKVTSDLVRMHGHDGDRPKLGGAIAFSMHGAAAETLALSGNGSKWRPLGRRSALYNQAPVSQRAATPRGLSGVIHGYPMGLAPSTDLLPNGSFQPNGYLAVRASSVRESASASLQATFRPT